VGDLVWDFWVVCWDIGRVSVMCRCLMRSVMCNEVILQLRIVCDRLKFMSPVMPLQMRAYCMLCIAIQLFDTSEVLFEHTSLTHLSHHPPNIVLSNTYFRSSTARDDLCLTSCLEVPSLSAFSPPPVASKRN